MMINKKKIGEKSQTVKWLQRTSRTSLSLGKLLEAIRLGEAISQSAFAKKLDISRSHLCDLEKGRKSVSAVKAAYYARILGYSEEQFVRLALQELLERSGLSFQVRIEAA